MKKIINLMVFDDIKENIELISTTLKEDKIKLIFVNNWEQAEELIHKVKIDLILFNYELNSSNQSTLYFKLRNENAYSQTPIIFMLSKSEDIDNLLIHEHPQDDFIQKPINERLLKAKVRSYTLKHKKIVDEYEEQIEKIKDNIKFIIPHEFRTSLNSILGLSNVINQITKNESGIENTNVKEIQDISSSLLNTVKYLQRISENLILYTQLQLMKSEKKTNIEISKSTLINSTEIITEAVNTLISEYDRRIDLEINLRPLYIQINGYFFYKIIYELIDNALKFSESGKKINIITSKEDNKFIFQISDNGRGMKPKEIKNIGAFIQFNRNLYEQQGVGLGLSLAKILTEMNDGVFSLHSKKTEGTEIMISLPLINRFL